jgi:hypothetical protein
MDELRRTHLPYCIHRTEDGRYIVLNRDYKPLGVQSSDWVIYETHPRVVALSITPTRAAKLDWQGRANIARIYLYNDSCIPTAGDAHMTAYLGRLAVLMKLKVKPPR